MEGADSFIAYLPEEEKDARQTKNYVEKHGQKCYLYPTNLKQKENCKNVVDEARSKMGAINILFNNHAYQMMTQSILDISEEQWEHTFDTNIHRESSPVLKYRSALTHLKHSSTSQNTPFLTCTKATQSSTMLLLMPTSAVQTSSITRVPKAPLCPSHEACPTNSLAKAFASMQLHQVRCGLLSYLRQ